MKKMKRNDIEEVELFSSEKYNDIIQICAILKDNNIAYIKKAFSPTFNKGYFYAIDYNSYFYAIKKIYVNKADYEKASKLISGYISYKDTNKQIEDDVYTPKLKRVGNILLIIFIGIPVLLCILGLILKSID